MGFLDRLTGRDRQPGAGARVVIHGAADRLAQGTGGLTAYRRLRVGHSVEVRLRPAGNASWPDALAVEHEGQAAGAVGMGEIVGLVADIEASGLAVHAPATVEDVHGKAFRVHLPWGGELASWWYLPPERRPAVYQPPRVNAPLGRYDVEREAAEALLQRRDILIVPCELTVEEVTRGQNKGAHRVVVTAKGHRVGLVAPTQRERHPGLFDAADAGAPGVVTIRRTPDRLSVRVRVH